MTSCDTILFTYTHRKKSNGVRSDDRAGHSTEPRLPIQRFGKIVWIYVLVYHPAGTILHYLEVVAEIINSALDEYFPDLSIKVTSEPGRYYVNTAFTLASNIHSVKEAVQTDPETKVETKIRMYYVGVSVFGGLIPVLFDEFFVTRSLNVRPDSELRPSIVWGPTCDTSDKVSEGVVSLPVMEAGDWIVFEETGAYTTSIACEFNGFPTPRIHSVIDEDGWFKLTRQVPYPVSKEQFMIGNSSEDFKIGLTNSS
ncbi:hypothetical protein NQ318_005400 [Aromia moschata]|uniref:Orn/DAP/Arg decarboxylase 2 C-terminal domain-containing protein n=1 Tax=Aromia moschata TaxID=1265417 RepID=A0AAV8YYM6_9CUCU|nr:hypothetical protein NQ318_005400 [Aromia moschata]